MKPKHLKILVYLIFLALFGIYWNYWEAPQTVLEHQEEQTTRSWKEVVDYARENFPLEGHLVAKSDGYIYLKVDDQYIHTLFPMLGLRAKGYEEPPYFRSPEAPGAHISVFYAEEDVIPEEIGQTFHFTLNDVVIVHPSRNASYAVLQVKAPELEKLRRKYGLGSKLHGHEFHITLAKRTASHFRPRGI